jgi:hypothetical protein
MRDLHFVYAEVTASKLYRATLLMSKTVQGRGQARLEKRSQSRDELFGAIAMDPMSSPLDLHTLDISVEGQHPIKCFTRQVVRELSSHQ